MLPRKVGGLGVPDFRTGRTKPQFATADKFLYPCLVRSVLIGDKASYPSGQRDLTVNQPSQTSGVRIPH